MYNEIEDLQDLAVAASLPYSDRQILNIGITLIKNMNEFEKAFKNKSKDAVQALGPVFGVGPP